jgi:hypothetical protein
VKFATSTIIVSTLTIGGTGLIAKVARSYLRVARAYFGGVPLELPGTDWIRVSRDQANDLRWVTTQLSSSATSYSVPGMPSFDFGTGSSLPTTFSINDVLAFASPARQAGIVQELWRLPGLCIFFNATVLQRFDRGQIVTNPPPLRYLNRDFVQRAKRNGYVILARRGGASRN